MSSQTTLNNRRYILLNTFLYFNFKLDWLRYFYKFCKKLKGIGNVPVWNLIKKYRTSNVIVTLQIYEVNLIVTYSVLLGMVRIKRQQVSDCTIVREISVKIFVTTKQLRKTKAIIWKLKLWFESFSYLAATESRKQKKIKPLQRTKCMIHCAWNASSAFRSLQNAQFAKCVEYITCMMHTF